MTAVASPPAIVLDQKPRGTAEPKSVQGVGLPQRQQHTSAPRYQQADPKIAFWNFIVQIGNQLRDKTNFDDECLEPTERAYERTFDLLQATPILPSGTIYPDGDGGLRVEWAQGSKQLRLAIHHTDPVRDYLYHQEGIGNTAQYDIVPLTDSSMLSTWLFWLLHPSAYAAVSAA